MRAIGLNSISLGRETASMSGGESQRVKMVRHLSSSLADIAYIFDEPSVGCISSTPWRGQRDKANTVLLVEHDPDVIAMADHVVDVGPSARKDGGHFVRQGDVAGLQQADTLTGAHEALATPRNRADCNA